MQLPLSNSFAPTITSPGPWPNQSKPPSVAWSPLTWISGWLFLENVQGVPLFSGLRVPPPPLPGKRRRSRRQRPFSSRLGFSASRRHSRLREGKNTARPVVSWVPVSRLDCFRQLRLAQQLIQAVTTSDPFRKLVSFQSQTAVRRIQLVSPSGCIFLVGAFFCGIRHPQKEGSLGFGLQHPVVLHPSRLSTRPARPACGRLEIGSPS